LKSRLFETLPFLFESLRSPFFYEYASSFASMFSPKIPSKKSSHGNMLQLQKSEAFPFNFCDLRTFGLSWLWSNGGYLFIQVFKMKRFL